MSLGDGDESHYAEAEIFLLNILKHILLVKDLNIRLIDCPSSINKAVNESAIV